MKFCFKNFLIVILSFLNLGWFWQSSVVKKNEEAKEFYKEEKFDEALSKWQDAQVDNPDKKELDYNIAGALHEKGEYEKAFSQYERVLDSKDGALKAKTYYNMGNTHYRMGKLPEAIQDYERSLEIDPDDEDAKYNIEFIKKKLEEQKMQAQGEEEEKQEKEQQRQQEQKEQQGEESEEKRKSEGEEKEEKEDRGEKEQEKEGPEEKGERASDERRETRDKRRATSDEREMSEEDALRILDALKDDEKDIQKKLRMQPMEGRYKVDKDW